jgi:surface polysaccharide O-acyltransferase-like enzyme
MVGYFKRPFSSALRGRFQVLILPLLFWSILAWAVYSILNGFAKFDLMRTFQLLPSTQMIHLAFLRDLFVIACFTPLLIKLLKLSPWVLIPLLAVGFALPMEPILLRGQILCYYSVGLFIALYKVDIPKLSVYWTLTLFLGLAAYITVFQPQSSLVDNALVRPITAWTFWVIATFIAASIFSPVIKKIEPAVFLLFLSHPLFGRILTGAYHQTGLEFDTIVWLLLPIVCYAIAILGRHLLTAAWVPDWVAKVITGKP